MLPMRSQCVAVIANTIDGCAELSFASRTAGRLLPEPQAVQQVGRRRASMRALRLRPVLDELKSRLTHVMPMPMRMPMRMR